MPKGYWGKVLRVNLTDGSIKTEEYDDDWYRTYYGGRGFIAYFLLKEVPVGVDALSPENRLIFAMGPLTGGPFSGSGRSSVGAKSPLTGGYGEGDVGGFWGAELKHAGFDAIVFEGKSEKPVYLWVHDGEAELRDATSLWGLSTLESQERIREELKDKRIRTAQIGPGGENQVRLACVINDLKHAAGRSGIGAVMGSKNLKAVACRGKLKLEVADAELVRKNAKWIADNFMEVAGGLYDLGTDGGLTNLSASGGLPTRNFQTGVFEGAAKITGQTMKDTILVDRENCYACVVRCKRVVEFEGPYKVNRLYGGPEYETAAAFGSLCAVDDLKAVSKANELCNAYSLDTIGTGNVIAWAMECFEKGLITTADTGGIELRFGNAEAMVKMVEQIAHREGFGNVLAEGTYRAAKLVGKGSLEFAMQVKGQELPMHEPRIKQGLGVGYSLSPTGADHCHNIHDTSMTAGPRMDRIRAMGLNIPPLRFDDIGPQKMAYYTHSVNWASVGNCVGMCSFIPYGFDRMVELMKGMTGWSVNVFEMMKVGERMNTLCRAYNLREGITAKDDTLPKRFFQLIGDPRPTTDTLDEGEWKAAKQTYYQLMGWNAEGVPTKAKLAELGADWVGAQIGV